MATEDRYVYTSAPTPLMLKDAGELLKNDYLPLEAGFGQTSDGMYHIAASTYMRNVKGEMIDWWFAHVDKTDSYLLWHPRDHVYSAWEGPDRSISNTGVGGHHIVQEYIGGELASLRISFIDPETYFGSDWRKAFDAAGYSTAICARVGTRNLEDGTTTYMGHLIHLIKNEPDGVRMRSRFWLGDVDGMKPEEAVNQVSPGLIKGLCKHCTEEMAILAEILPGLYQRLHDRL